VLNLQEGEAKPGERERYAAMMALFAQADPITITSHADGRHEARLPLPALTVLSPQFIGFDGVIEAVLIFRCSNVTARYRVRGVNDWGQMVAERIDDEPAAGGG